MGANNIRTVDPFIADWLSVGAANTVAISSHQSSSIQHDRKDVSIRVTPYLFRH